MKVGFFILGDLNCNLLEPTLQTTKKLQEIFKLYQLTQLINNPTRITKSTRSLLDVCFTSSPEKVPSQDSGIVHLGVGDHSLTYAIQQLNSITNKESKGCVEIRNFKNSVLKAF